MNIESLHQSLLAKRAELTDRLDRALVDMHRREGALSADFEEQAVERENDEVVTRISESTANELGAVNRAIARLSQGTYGKCSNCGAEIDAARLAARPEAETCISCSHS